MTDKSTVFQLMGETTASIFPLATAFDAALI